MFPLAQLHRAARNAEMEKGFEDGSTYGDRAADALDDPFGITFTRQIEVGSCQTWFNIRHNLPEFALNKPGHRRVGSPHTKPIQGWRLDQGLDRFQCRSRARTIRAAGLGHV